MGGQLGESQPAHSASDISISDNGEAVNTEQASQNDNTQFNGSLSLREDMSEEEFIAQMDELTSQENVALVDKDLENRAVKAKSKIRMLAAEHASDTRIFNALKEFERVAA